MIGYSIRHASVSRKYLKFYIIPFYSAPDRKTVFNFRSYIQAGEKKTVTEKIISRELLYFYMNAVQVIWRSQCQSVILSDSHTHTHT